MREILPKGFEVWDVYIHSRGDRRKRLINFLSTIAGIHPRIILANADHLRARVMKRDHPADVAGQLDKSNVAAIYKDARD